MAMTLVDRKCNEASRRGLKSAQARSTNYRAIRATKATQPQESTIAQRYSCRNDSMGSSLAANLAGSIPKTIPTEHETTMAMSAARNGIGR